MFRMFENDRCKRNQRFVKQGDAKNFVYNDL